MSALKVVFVGDSISDVNDPTYGYALSPAVSSASQVWTSLIQSRLTAQFPSVAFSFVNVANSGKTWSFFETNLTSRITSQRGDIYIVLLGINDAYTEIHTPGYDMTPHMDAVLNGIDGITGINTGDAPLVILCSFVKPNEGRYVAITGAEATACNTEIGAEAVARGYRFANVWSAFAALQTSPPSWNAVNPYFGTADGIHPNALGMDVIADTVEPLAVQAVSSLTTSLLITPNAYWTQSGTTLSVNAPVSVATSVEASVTSTLGGTLRFDGTNAARFTASLDDVTYTATVEVPAGTSTVYLAVTPQPGDQTLTARVGVPI